MKITMYELYGKIYNENPPKHIRVYGEDWYWNDYDGYVTKESLKTTPDAQIYLMDRYRTFMKLHEEVEIIEEEKKIPEKLPKWATTREDKEYTKQEDHILIVSQKVDEIIDYLNSKGDE